MIKRSFWLSLTIKVIAVAGALPLSNWLLPDFVSGILHGSTRSVHNQVIRFDDQPILFLMTMLRYGFGLTGLFYLLLLAFVDIPTVRFVLTRYLGLKIKTEPQNPS